MLTALLICFQTPLPKWQDSPGPETVAIKRQIDLAAMKVAGIGVSAILSDPTFDSIRSYPRFRDLIKARADSKPVTMVSSSEPGERLELTFDLSLPDRLIYAYHTDSRGAYGANAVHIRGDSGDHKHARLFAYAKTGPDGRATFLTIRPAGYPEGELPQHIHFQIWPARSTIDEIWFSDDQRITPSMRERGRNSALIVTPQRVQSGWKAVAKITLP